MPADVSDQLRILSFKADGKTNLLMPTGFSATERMSGLFQVHVDLLAVPEKASGIQAEQLLGKRMTLRVLVGEDPSQGPYRYFDGMCCRFASVGKDARYHYFQAELVPWLWLLTKRADCRVFQDKNVPDIVETVLKELQQDYSEFRFEIRANRGEYKKIDYCVQFRETHFNFISRLLEQDGLYYYFEHTAGGHQLIIDDSPTAGDDLQNQSVVRYAPISGMGQDDEDTISAWREERVIHSGKFAARDYHPQMAQNRIDFSDIAPKTSVANNGKLEVFDWPSASALRYNQTDQRLDEVTTVGTKLTNLSAQQEEVTHRTLSGSSLCREFTPGYRFSLKHEPGKKYLLTSVRHSAVQSPNYNTNEAVRTPYGNTFTCIPADVQFRPQRETPKPVVDGLQTAKVVGKQGEEIWIDKYGRVRVQFFWDRKGENDEKSTCWVRVGQMWAGKRWGAFFWPRIGQEVLVAFVEGDPDQPLIVGSVYNSEQMPPYLGDGPDSKHKHDPNVSGIKTNSTKGGDGFNELRFDDTKDKEQVFIHAERNMDVRVKNDSLERIYGNRHQIIGWEKDGKKGGDQREMVYQDKHLNIKRHQVEHIEGNYQLMVGNGEAEEGGNLDIVVEKKRTELVQEDSDLHVMGDQKEAIDKTLSVTVGEDHFEKVGSAPMMGTYALEAGKEIHLQSGANVVIEAGALGSLTIKGAGGFISIDATGVTIQGMLVKINSGGVPGIGSGSHPQSPEDAKEAVPTKPSMADDAKTGNKSC